MKKNVLVFGLIAGLLITAMMLYSTTMCYTDPDFRPNDVLGYVSMILIFSLIFVGIKNFRDKYNNGTVTFGKAFKIGLYISLIAASMYTIVWLIDYYIFIPDFMDRYTAHVLQAAKDGGATQPELTEKAAEMAKFKELYKNPLMVVLITFLEVLPIGIVITLISALILKRKHPKTAIVQS